LAVLGRIKTYKITVGRTWREERICQITGCQSAWTLYRIVCVPMPGLAGTVTVFRDVTEDTLPIFAWGITA